MLSHIDVSGQPRVQSRSVGPGSRHPLPYGRSCDPGADRPLLPVEKTLVAKQVGAAMVLGKRGRHALQLLPAEVVPLFAQRVDDAHELYPGCRCRHRLAKAGELCRVQHVAPTADNQPVRPESDVAAVARGGIDVGFVRRLVGRETDVAIRPRQPGRSEAGLEVGEKRHHRSSYVLLVLSSVGLENPLRVVPPQPGEEALEVTRPASELASHGRSIAAGRQSTYRDGLDSILVTGETSISSLQAGYIELAGLVRALHGDWTAAAPGYEGWTC